jgi:hypothetical protein
VYVPVSVVPCADEVNVTVAPVLRTTFIVSPEGIVSLTVAVMLIAWPGLYEPSAVVEENAVIVGGMATVTVVDAEFANAGPVDVPLLARTAPFAANCGRTVPSSQVGVTVYTVVLTAVTAKVHVALPVLEKSALVTPVTAVLKVSVKVGDGLVVGELTALLNDETVTGAVPGPTPGFAASVM